MTGVLVTSSAGECDALGGKAEWIISWPVQLLRSTNELVGRMREGLPEPAVHHATSSVPAEWDAPLACAHAGWAGLPIVLHRLPGTGEAISDIYLPEPLLAVARTGSGTRRYTSGVHSWDLCSAPGLVELHGAGFQLDHIRWDGTPGEVVTIQFPAAMINRLLHEEGPPRSSPASSQGTCRSRDWPRWSG